MDYPKIIPMYAEPETFELGVTEIQLSGVTVRIFERERLICECLKYEDKMDRERFKEGLMAYIKDPKKDIAKLMYYAKKLPADLQMGFDILCFFLLTSSS